nr:hypothetical protein Iba_chr07eCG1170 [Ipomoea batatas]GMD20085.1 hypothetical protein Iba_chr07fCG1460 [Ipomoea batatas]
MVPDNTPLEASMSLPCLSSMRLWVSTSSCISPDNCNNKLTLSCSPSSAFSFSCSSIS